MTAWKLALAELRDTVRDEPAGMLSQVSPTAFETVVLDLLQKMACGISRADLQASPVLAMAASTELSWAAWPGESVRPGKRWQGAVGQPDVQEFYGALAGQRANKGVFMTTSTLTSQAIEFARSVERVVLVDGSRLTDLMSEHEVGVTLRPVKVPKVDSDYFEE